MFTGDQRAMMTRAFGQPEYGDTSLRAMAQDKLYLGSQFALKLYSQISQFNQKVALNAALREAWGKGFRGEEAYREAIKIKHLANASGGKANLPGYVNRWSNESTQGAWSTYHTLQQYGMSLVGHYAELGQEALGKVPGLSGADQRAAQKAFGTMLATQIAVSGMLGVPFAGALLTGIEKTTGWDAEAALREGLQDMGSTVFGEDFANMVMTGGLNQLTGLDLGSRMGIGGFLGTSYYNGFSVKDLVGPLGGLVGNVAKAAGFAQQGEGLKAVHALMPNGMKNPYELAVTNAKYDDFGFRDQSNRLIYQPNVGEVAGYAVGFRPTELTRRQNASRMLNEMELRDKAKRSADIDQQALKLLEGRTAEVQAWAREQTQKTPGSGFREYQELLKAVSAAAVDMTNERDLLSSGSRRTAEDRRGVVETFGTPNRQNEQQRLMQSVKQEISLGLPVNARDVTRRTTRAMLVDQLVKERGMTRSQALQLVEAAGY